MELRIGYLVWPKDVQNSSKALVLFWNTSSMWHIPLVIFQDSAAYMQYAQYVALENAYLSFLADHFRLPDVLQSHKCSPCLVLISASGFPSFVILAPRYVNSVTSSISCSPSLTGSAV